MLIKSFVRRFSLLTLGIAFLAGIVNAQERTITGKVTSASGEPLPGVNVVVQGTVTGTMTDGEGNYSIRVPGPSAVLTFSLVGFQSKSVAVDNQNIINVTLEIEVRALEEIVVTGYSSQRRRDITGSVAVVETSQLTAIPTGQVSNQLQGRTSGVTVLGSGQPGETSKVRIRGFASFEANDPLYIVDGVPTQDISSMNPNDVESVTVLKDAGAASVYGARASNGVIVVTTKKGSKGIKVTYDMFSGTQLPGKGPDNLLTTQEYADLQWLIYKNDGTSEVHPIYGPSTNPKPTLPNWAANTNWYDVITDPAGITNHDLTFSGGTENANYFAGLGYFKQNGIVKYTSTERFSGRFNSEWSFLDGKFKFGENFTGSYRSNLGVANLNEGSPIQMGPYRAQPIVPNIITVPITGLSHNFVPGEYGGTGIAPRLGNNSNAFADLERDKDDKYWNIRVIGSAFFDISIFKGLNFRSTIGGTWYNGYNVNFTCATYENSENVATPSLNEGSYYGNEWVWTNTLSLNKIFGQHRIQAVGGYEAIKTGIGRNVNANAAGYFSTAIDFRTLTNGASITGANSYFYTPTALVSMFLKADYGFKERYFLSATIRRDGSSKFGEDTRYGIFPAVSAGWRIGDEAFLDGLPWISDLKIRGSYGTMGNQLALSPVNQFFLYGGDVSSSFYDLNGTGTSSLQGFRPTRIGNPDAKWETNVTSNIGFEAQLLNNKLGIVFDWYSKQTKDLLFNPELPGTAGDAEAPYINIASMSNTGIDMEVSFKNTWGDFGVNITGTLTTYKNEIKKIAEGYEFFDWGGSRIGGFVRNMVGHPLSSFYGYHVIGLFQNSADTTSSPWQDGYDLGFFKFANYDTTTAVIYGKRRQIINPDDRTFIGNPNPDFTYGLNISLTWKNFDLSGFFYGSQGNDIFNWNKWWIDFWPSFQGQKSTDLLYNSWTPQNPNAKTPKASNKSNFSTNTQVCDYYIEDGSYIRLKNLQIGYTLPDQLLSKLKIKTLRVYVQGINLFTVTKYSGLDPEIGGEDRNFGVDYGNYPNAKQFIFGLNLTL